MKIIIIVNTSWNIYNFRKKLLISLIEIGHEVIAVAPHDSYVELVESLGIKCINIRLNQKGTNPFSDSLLIYKYYKIFKSQKPDLILGYTIKPNIYGNIAAGLLKIPTINNISGLGTLFIKTSLTTIIAKCLYKFSLRYSSHVFFQNKDDKKLFIKNKLVNPNITSIIPGSGIDVQKFSCDRVKNEGNKFLFVGRLIGDKGVFEYLDAAVLVLKKHPEKEFLLVGEIGYNNKTALSKEQLLNYTDNYAQIRYLGNTDDIVGLLKSVDVVVLPSYREGLSKSLIEAASMSLPIITTDSPGCRDVVKNNYNGILCKIKSSESLSSAMLRMIKLSPNKRLQMGFNGRKIAIKIFEQKIIINHYLKVLKLVV
jgi:glycosyltransferase involved in cell wall biosynthesis